MHLRNRCALVNINQRDEIKRDKDSKTRELKEFCSLRAEIASLVVVVV